MRKPPISHIGKTPSLDLWILAKSAFFVFFAKTRFWPRRTSRPLSDPSHPKRAGLSAPPGGAGGSPPDPPRRGGEGGDPPFRAAGPELNQPLKSSGVPKKHPF